VVTTPAEANVLHEPAPDTRGPSTPASATPFWLGVVALTATLGGTIALQLNYALSPRVLTATCVDLGLTRDITGAVNVCNFVEALRSSAETALLYGGIAVGVAAAALGWGTYRRMDTVRRREQAVTGAILGLEAVAIAVLIIVFRNGKPNLFGKNFLNFAVIDRGYFPAAFFRAMKNTVVLAFVGEFGGIAIGLLLSMLTLSKRRAARAPARMYINFFRGTPLIWQLATGYFIVLLGFGVHQPSSYLVAAVVLALNTGAYSAEVFRAGIQSIERGQIEAARSLGMTYLQAMRYAVIPQAIRRVIPPLMNEFVILIKDTALVLVLGLLESQNELFTWAKEGQSDTFNATFFTASALGYLAVTLPLIRLVNAVERRLRSGLVGIVGGGG
jgi:His/Glu/Gln/Arg/opine family amino acid ABC transporter permease subunit